MHCPGVFAKNYVYTNSVSVDIFKQRSLKSVIRSHMQNTYNSELIN